VWAEPDADHLANLMRRAFERKAGLSSTPVENSSLAPYTWAAVARRNVEAATAAAVAPVAVDPRVGWISTFNKRCGIATYSKHLLDVLGMPTVILAGDTEQPLGPEPENLVRCWGEGKPDELIRLRAAVEQFDLDLIVLQFNYGFYDFDHLSTFINWLVEQRKRVVVFMHATTDPAHEPERQLAKIARALSRCDRILVHSVNDMNRLKAHGLIENVGLFPHGVLIPEVNAQSLPVSGRPRGAPVRIASYGFFLPNKGLLELIEAVHLLRSRGLDYRLSLINAEFPAAVSQTLIQQAKALITKLKLSQYVMMRTDFLSDEQSLSLLSQAELVVYPYQTTAESASGAVRYGLASGKPVAVTPLSIFDDVSDYAFTLPGMSPEAIADGISTVVASLRDADPAAVARLEQAVRWRDTHGYRLLGRRLAGMLKGVFGDHDTNNSPSSGKTMP
jgi:glycosyltransferase involved in cell wall biosynthesis